MAGSIYFPRVSSPVQETSYAFEIKPSGSGYYIGDGVCFSTFSFNTGSFVPIKNLNTFFKFEKDFKVFIEIDVLPNLQPSGAQIKWGKVGSNGSMWKNYPLMFEVQPQDEFDKDGRVIKLIDNKFQTKCFVLIGYRKDDQQKSGPSPIDEKIGTAPVQILDTDFVLLASVVSGIPMLFPSPFFNGTRHIKAIKGVS